MARKRPRIGERFAMLPLSVMLHPAFKTLPVGYQRVLWVLAAQYDGTNNGDLALTRKQAVHFGLNNERHRTLGLRELETRGLIERTSTVSGLSYGGATKPTLWALSWRSVDCRDGRKLDMPRLPSFKYQEWQAPDTHVASAPTRTGSAGNGSPDTHVASTKGRSPTRTLIAPSENLHGGVRLAVVK